MELELGLALPDSRPAAPPGLQELGLIRCTARGSCGKRASAEAFGPPVKHTLTLFVPEEGNSRRGGDDSGGGADWETSSKRKKLVGWPPVKHAHRHTVGGGAGYVKVKMEGVAIGRKVDVSLHSSYEELLDTLHRMFPSTTNHAGVEPDPDDRRRRRPCAVTYEDGDGDWMLVGDVPWEVFAKSVKRLKILV